jgi:hypothetical protein
MRPSQSGVRGSMDIKKRSRNLPFINVKNDIIMMNNNEINEEEKFQIDDTQGRLITPFSQIPQSQNANLRSHLEPLKLNKTQLFNCIL